MSLFTSFLESISGSSGLSREAAASQARTDAATEEALAAQRGALRRAELAATPALDKESTRLAGEAQMRRMLAAAGMRWQGQPVGDAPVGYTTAYGE